MNTWKKILFVGTCLLVAACGDSSSNTSNIPTPANPNPPGGSLPPSGNYGTPGLPDITLSHSITLSDRTNYSAIIDLKRANNEIFSGSFTVPPMLKMTLSGRSKTTVPGKMLVWWEEEDQSGFWGAEVPTVDGAAIQGNNGTTRNFDTIHSDSQLSFRVLAQSNDGVNLYGIIYYRIRQSGETQCLKQKVTCIDPWTGQQLPDSFCQYTTPDIVTPCRNYMNPGDSNVKTMGTFTSTINDWFPNG